jgi:hypothetical protein
VRPVLVEQPEEPGQHLNVLRRLDQAVVEVSRESSDHPTTLGVSRVTKAGVVAAVTYAVSVDVDSARQQTVSWFAP